jgi:predicted transcriptional regulator
MSLVSQIQRQMESDDTDDSDRLEVLYENADEKGKALLDDALICLCGYSFKSLKEMEGTA